MHSGVFKIPSVRVTDLGDLKHIEEIIRAHKLIYRYVGILSVVDSEQKFVGIITDGDIRRASVFSPNVKTLGINYNPVVVTACGLTRFIGGKPIRFGIDCLPTIEFVPVIREGGICSEVVSVEAFLANNVAIIGMGYVGLTLAAHLGLAGLEVTGVEVNQKIVRGIIEYQSHVDEPGLQPALKDLISKGRLKLTNQATPKGVYIISVGTPVGLRGKPVYRALLDACSEVGRRLHVGSLVMFRSTVGVGTTRKCLIPALELASGLRAGSGFNVAFCPERTAEGVALKELKTLPQLVSGYSNSCRQKASSFWGRFSGSVVECGSLEEAELAKLANNSFRDVSFAFANQLALISEKFGVSSFNVIKAANQGYVRNRIPTPSPGVGGYCLTKDPFILASALPKGEKTLMAVGRQINDSSIKIPVRIFRQWMKESSIAKNKSRLNLLIVGIAFKGTPATADVRGSSSLVLSSLLRRTSRAIKISFFDFEFNGSTINDTDGIMLRRVKRLSLGSFDAIFIMNNHEAHSKLKVRNLKKGSLLFDGFGQFSSDAVPEGVVYKTL